MITTGKTPKDNMKKTKNNRGFSLLEAVLAVMILAVGFFSTTILISNISISAISSDQNIIGTQLANEKVESILADKKFLGFSYVDNSHYPLEILTGDYSGYQRNVSVAEVQPGDLMTPSPGSGIKKISVTVSWGSAAWQQVKVSGMVSKYN